jgi:lipopolysaccharide export system permease protein
MKTLHLYLTRQILASLVMTVVVFTFVLMLANVLKEVLPLLISGQVPIGVFAQAAGLLIPFAWVFALPMGLLTATLLIFGRFSADQELTAVRASGISLLSLARPVLLLSLVLCGVSALVNMEIGPRCREAYTGLRSRLAAELSKVALPEGFTKDIPGYILYIGKNRRGSLEDVTIFQLENETNWMSTTRAPRGRVEIDVPNRIVNLYLDDAKTVMASGATASGSGVLQFPLPSRKEEEKTRRVDDMTFSELRHQLQELERPSALPLVPKRSSPARVQAPKQDLERLRQLQASKVRVLMHRQVAFSFACFGFTLVGIPLGIRMHRRETNIGFGIALVLVALYYCFLMLGQSLDKRPEYLPHLIVWAPNVLFQGVGAVLLWRANRGG